MYNDIDTEFKDKVNMLIAEEADGHDIHHEELRQMLIKKHPKVFPDELNGIAMKMETVLVK